MANIEPPVFNRKSFSVKPFSLRVIKPWGYEIIFTSPDLPYSGKIIHVLAGKKLSLQVHDKKQESYYLASGRCNVVLENNQGELETVTLESGKGYTVGIGQKHRLWAVTDCDVFEVATPEIGTTYRLEDDYKRPDETEALRAQERRSKK